MSKNYKSLTSDDAFTLEQKNRVNNTAQKLFIANIIDPLHDKYLSISIMILDQSRSVESTHSVDRCEEQDKDDKIDYY